MFWADVPAGLAAGSAGLLLAAFLVTWYFSVDNGAAAPKLQAQQQNVTAAPVAALPAPAGERPVSPSAPAPAGLPAIPSAPEAVREFLPLAAPRPVPAAADAPSRWTRTFGPPETGSLPLQPYVPARRASVQTADPSAQDRRQRSHSSL